MSCEKTHNKNIASNLTNHYSTNLSVSPAKHFLAGVWNFQIVHTSSTFLPGLCPVLNTILLLQSQWEQNGFLDVIMRRIFRSIWSSSTSGLKFAKKVFHTCNGLITSWWYLPVVCPLHWCEGVRPLTYVNVSLWGATVWSVHVAFSEQMCL